MSSFFIRVLERKKAEAEPKISTKKNETEPTKRHWRQGARATVSAVADREDVVPVSREVVQV